MDDLNRLREAYEQGKIPGCHMGTSIHPPQKVYLFAIFCLLKRSKKGGGLPVSVGYVKY